MKKKNIEILKKKEYLENLFFGYGIPFEKSFRIIKGSYYLDVKKVIDYKISDNVFCSGFIDVNKNKPLNFETTIYYYCNTCGKKYIIPPKLYKERFNIGVVVSVCQKCKTLENSQKEEFKNKQRLATKKGWSNGRYAHLNEYFIKWGRENCRNMLYKSEVEKKEIAIKKINTWFKRSEEDRAAIDKIRTAPFLKYRSNFIFAESTYHTKEWINISRELRKKNKNICSICNKTFIRKNLDVHHIIPRYLSKCDDVENLIVLCKSCHRKLDIKTSLYIKEDNHTIEEINNFARKIIQENKENNNT